MAIQNFSSIGGDLQGLMRDLALVPDDVLKMYSQSAKPIAKDNVTEGLAVASELARRARTRAEMQANQNPDPQGLPTVLEGLLSGQMADPGGTPAPVAGISAFSQQPQQAQQSQQPQQIVLNQPKTATAPTLATPYSAPKLPTPPSQPARKMANGGIVALAGGGDTGKQEPEESLEEALIRDSAIDPNLKDPAIRAALMRTMREDAAKGIPFSYKPQPAPSAPSAPSALSAPSAPSAPPTQTGLRQLLIQRTPELYERAGVNKTFSPEAAEKARTEAAQRLKAVVDPRMAEIRRLNEEAQGIGARRDEGALSRSFIAAGLRGLQESAPRGSAAYTLGAAGSAGFGAHEKEQAGMIERALQANKTKIALEEALMRQGVDQITASNVAEKEARRVHELADTESRNIAKTQYDILSGGVAAETAAEREARLRGAEDRLRAAEDRRERELRARIDRANNPRLTDSEREHHRRVAGYMQDGHSEADANRLALRDRDQLKAASSEVRLSKDAQEALAKAKLFDDEYRRAKTPEEKAAREKVLLEKIRSGQPTFPGSSRATPAAPSGPSGGARRELSPGVYVTERP